MNSDNMTFTDKYWGVLSTGRKVWNVIYVVLIFSQMLIPLDKQSWVPVWGLVMLVLGVVTASGYVRELDEAGVLDL